MSQPPEECPKCDVPSPCIHYDSVHNGVGLQYFDHMYECQTHGEWAPTHRYEYVCTQHEDCREHPELGRACADSLPRFIFRDEDLPVSSDPQVKP